MEYISKQLITDTFEKLVKSREQKANCSKKSAMEYQIYKYCLSIVNSLETVEKD